MFPSRREVLKQKEGTFAKVPLPLLLHALSVEERSCLLELKLRNLEKRIVFEDGIAIGCSSNLLHETLGKYLVTKNKLSETDYQHLLTECAQSGKPMGAVLVEKKKLNAFDLFKHMQANLAHKILDAFRWSEASWRIIAGDDSDTPIRMNTAQLVFTGCAQVPMDNVRAHFPVPHSQRFALMPDSASPMEELKLSPKDMRLIQLLKGRPSVHDLINSPGFDEELVLRRLFALSILEMVDLAERVDAMPKKPANAPAASAPAPVSAPQSGSPAHAAPPNAAPPPVEDDERNKLALAEAFLAFRGKDPFDLLGVPLDVQGPALQRAFLAKAEALSPMRFRSPDSKSKAEALLVAYAKAFGALAHPETNELARKRRAALEQSATPRKTSDSGFRIRTDLLDADTQFTEGQKRLAQGNFKAAVDYFQYAYDIEPKPRIQAYLAWARYKFNPITAGPHAMNDMAAASEADPKNEEIWALRGQLAVAVGAVELAETCFREASRINPKRERSARNA